MKKFVGFIIFFLSLFLPISADDGIVYTRDEWTYTANPRGWTITGYNGTKKNVDIPYEFDGIQVTQLGANLFLNDPNVERLSIPSQVTVIGKNAFRGCSYLRSVTLPFTITTIPEGCFKDCSSLESITLPATLKSIAKDAFSGCAGLQEVNIPRKVTSVGEAAFKNCTSLRYIYVQKNLATIGADAFTNTAWLDRQTDEFVYLGRSLLIKYNGSDRNVTIPYGTTAIANAFEENKIIESVVIPETVRRIMQNAFKNAVNLKSVSMPQYVTSVGAGAFSGCVSLEKVDFSFRITSIGANAFNGCSRLRELVVPEKVKTIPAGFAANCPVLRDVWLPPSITKIDKSAFAGSGHVIAQVFPGSASEQSLEIYGVDHRGYLSETDGLVYEAGLGSVAIVRYRGRGSSVEIPAEIDGLAVTEIKTAAFQNNPFVHAVFIPESVKRVGDWAFSYMDKLEFVHFADGFRRIGANAFTGSLALSEIVFPSSVSFIGNDAFDGNVQTVFCTPVTSKAQRVLEEKGYNVIISDHCSDTYAEAIPAEGEADFHDSCELYDADIFRVPDGMSELGTAFISNAGNKLLIQIPPAVTTIDPAILEGRSVIIIGEPHSEAERFAREYGLKFLVNVDMFIKP